MHAGARVLTQPSAAAGAAASLRPLLASYATIPSSSLPWPHPAPPLKSLPLQCAPGRGWCRRCCGWGIKSI